MHDQSKTKMVRVYVIGGGIYFSLILMLINTEFYYSADSIGHVRVAFGMALVDLPLLPFPNNLYLLFLGVTDSKLVATILTGIANLAFFWQAELLMRSRRRWVERVYMFAGYLLFSACTFFMSSYLFFSFFFMQS